MKVFANLLNLASQNKEVNYLRYSLSLRQLDPTGSGWVDVEKILKILPGQFKVKPKTVLNNLYLCENKGFGNFDMLGYRFYYYEQVRMLAALGGQLTSRKAVYIDDFTGSVVEARAKIHKALLGSNGCELMMTRATISDISGRAKKTQRKYEKLSNITVKPNYARFTEYNGNQHELASVRFSGHAAFIMHDQKTNKHYIAKQLCNSYLIDLKSTKKKTQHPLIKKDRGNVQRVFFNNLKSAMKAWNAEDASSDVYFWNEQDKIYEWQTPVNRWLQG